MIYGLILAALLMLLLATYVMMDKTTIGIRWLPFTLTGAWLALILGGIGAGVEALLT